MKNFADTKGMYMKIVALQDEVKNILQNYIEKENIGIPDYTEKLYDKFNEVSESIFAEVNNGKSESMNYLIRHMENEEGDAQIISAFIRAYITDQILVEIVSFEELEEVAHEELRTK